MPVLSYVFSENQTPHWTCRIVQLRRWSSSSKHISYIRITNERENVCFVGYSKKLILEKRSPCKRSKPVRFQITVMNEGKGGTVFLHWRQRSCYFCTKMSHRSTHVATVSQSSKSQRELRWRRNRGQNSFALTDNLDRDAWHNDAALSTTWTASFAVAVEVPIEWHG